MAAVTGLLRSLLRLPGQHMLPGVLVLLLSAGLLCCWEVARLTGPAPGQPRRSGRLGRLRDWQLPAAGIVLAVAACVCVAARFIMIG